MRRQNKEFFAKIAQAKRRNFCIKRASIAYWLAIAIFGASKNAGSMILCS
jgi:hypothetical protein